MGAEILLTDSPARLEAAVERAAALLRAGNVVALPTETVYGLAAAALDPAAVARVFALKGRPAHNPVIVHVASLAMARACARAWPPAAERLAARFWPGPLTLVVPRAACVPDIVTAGGETVALRWPSHPVMRAVIERCGFPLAAPSANPSNALSPTTAAHVAAALGAPLELILDGGPATVGIESTVVDVTTSPARVLRPGMLDEALLAATLGAPVEFGSTSSATPVETASSRAALRSPGNLQRHYAPRTRLYVWRWTDGADLAAQLIGHGIDLAAAHVLYYSGIELPAGLQGATALPREPETFARLFYATLHELDDSGAGCLIVEAPPNEAAWRAIRDRLARAAADGE